MKILILSMLGMFCCVGGESQVVESKLPAVMGWKMYLSEMGNRLECYFTVETRGFELAGHKSDLAEITNDLTINSMPRLLAKLRYDWKAFSVVQDAKHSNIVHIIEKVLEADGKYVLNKRISLHYSGNLVPCTVLDLQGRNQSKGEGLVVALSKKVGGMRDGSDQAGTEGAMTDCYTVVDVDATNAPVRSILADSLPLTNYNRILWQAFSVKGKGDATEVLVQFFGQKRP